MTPFNLRERLKNRILGKAGTPRFAPRHAMRADLCEVMTHLKTVGVRPNTVIDVGVAYGTPGLYGVFDDVRYLAVEPLREYEETLSRLRRDYGAEIVLAAAAASAGEATLNVHPDLSGSSTYKEIEGSRVDGEPRTVPTIRLDETVRSLDLPGPYLLKVDVQGAELDVLDGVTEIIDQVAAVVTEANLLGMFVGAPQLAEMVAAMKARGFVVYDIFGGHRRPLDDALAQVDLVFVPEKGSLRSRHAWATPKQREALTKQRIKHLNRSR